MEDKLSAILGNPQLMQQIMSMAQSLGQATPEPPEQHKEQSSHTMPDIDPAVIRKIMSLVGKTNIDQNQKALLCALQPYLSSTRLQKLEKAMRAARLAGAASGLLQSGVIPF